MSGRVEPPAFYEERLRLLMAENQQLRDALRWIATAQPSSEDAVTLAKGFLLLQGRARAALDGTPSAAQTLEEQQTTRGTGSS